MKEVENFASKSAIIVNLSDVHYNSALWMISASKDPLSNKASNDITEGVLSYQSWLTRRENKCYHYNKKKELLATILILKLVNQSEWSLFERKERKLSFWRICQVCGKASSSCESFVQAEGTVWLTRFGEVRIIDKIHKLWRLLKEARLLRQLIEDQEYVTTASYSVANSCKRGPK